MTSRAFTAAPALLAGLAAALSGCGHDFLPQSYLSDARILAVVSDPSEVWPGETVTLTPYVYEPPLPSGTPAATRTWSFCPLTLGSASAFDCAVPECETPLAPAADGTVTADPSVLALACLTTLGGTIPGAPSGAVPDSIEPIFRLDVLTAGGLLRESVTRVVLHTSGTPVNRNQAPVIAGVDLDGVPAAENAVGATIPVGGKVHVVVHIDPASIDSYDPGDGRSVQEIIVVSFFTTAGRLDWPRDDGPDAEDTLAATDLEAGQDHADLWMVARDLRGGEAVAGPYEVDFGP